MFHDEPAYQFEVTPNEGGRTPRRRILTPRRITGGQISDATSLQNVLDQHSHQFLSRHSQSISDRRWYMERVRPALRWYCRQYGVAVPDWLTGNGGYDDLDPDEHQRLFGEDPLHAQEFQSWGEAISTARGHLSGETSPERVN